MKVNVKCVKIYLTYSFSLCHVRWVAVSRWDPFSQTTVCFYITVFCLSHRLSCCRYWQQACFFFSHLLYLPLPAKWVGNFAFNFAFTISVESTHCMDAFKHWPSVRGLKGDIEDGFKLLCDHFIEIPFCFCFHQHCWSLVNHDGAIKKKKRYHNIGHLFASKP